MNDAVPLGLQNDATARHDLLGFDAYCTALTEAILSSPPPFTLGVFGEWGCGKTTLMEFVKARIAEKPPERGFRTVWFNAWRFNGETAIWNAMLRSVLREMESAGISGDEEVKTGFLAKVGRVAKSGARVAITSGAKLASGGVITDEEINKVFDAMADAKPTWNALDERSALEEEFKSLVTQFVGEHGRLIMFVDDLDRCGPEQAIAVLEAMKFFFDHDNCMFVIGADRVVLEGYVDDKYKAIKHKSGRDYLEKLIQLPFNMSAIDPSPALQILAAYDGAFDLTNSKLRALVLAGTHGNPRRIKRFGNIYMLLTKLRPIVDGDETTTVVFAIMLQMRFPRYFEEITRNLDLLQKLVKVAMMERADRPLELEKHAVLKEMYGDVEFVTFFERAYPDIDLGAVQQWLLLTKELVA